MDKRLQLINISKTFPGGVQANKDVSLDVKRGEIHCLLGENGAGKSTLMSILYGEYHPDSGEIWLNGEKISIPTPKIAIEHGVGMVHQHFMLVPTLSVAENIIMGMKPLASFLWDMKEIEKDIARFAVERGMKINPSALISSLSVGEQQRVEIIKALYRGVDLLILDEPTAVLTPQETHDLFETLHKLAEQDFSIILITHKMNEVMEVADRVSVLRDGRVIGTLPIANVTPAILARMMVGRDVSFNLEKSERAYGEPVLRVQALNLIGDKNRQILKDIALEVCSGEIVGIAGVDGNGQNQLALCITGLMKPTSGHILFDRKEMAGKSPLEFLKTGVGHIPEDRHAMGLVMEDSVADNFMLQRYNDKFFKKLGFLNMTAIMEYAKKLVKFFDVRTNSVKTAAGNLSGGNQQKIIVGREIDRNPKLLVAVQPTRGLDIGATEYIHKQLLQQREKGAALLLISTELEEILALSDRILVMFGGRIVGETSAGRANVDKIGLLMAGMQAEKE
ncbi:MAG: ABC transporter ATP-binding protein [Anaerolineaceae bacterium]|nr:ABC transporter ATP-binding protein [Anaerolineaceae bacterium]